MTPLLRRLRAIIEQLDRSAWHPYSVPGKWVGSDRRVVFPSAPSYLRHQLDRVESLMRTRHTWNAREAVLYNASVRHVTSYDHGDRAKLDGWRTTGTFLKLLTILPYLRQMGVTTILLLPITEIGRVGKKGEYGSPYAARHPYRIDEMLAEPLVDMSVDDQARAFVEACHFLGMKVVLEVVLRTASVDSELARMRPEWFYWIDEAELERQGGVFTAPTFSDDDISIIRHQVEERNFVSLPEPSEEYRNLFTSPPSTVIVDDKGPKGLLPDGRVVRIPGAFADWPVDDPQPAWSDVTYVKLHDHPHFRYMAYNTIRMFDKALDAPAYRQQSLWNTITGLVPHFMRTLNIDGVMIDMGHAFPADLRRRIVSEIRATKPDALVFEENFTIDRRSVSDGYDGVIGYLPFDAWDVSRLRDFIERLSNKDVAVRYFATAESHNTPRIAARIGGKEHAACLWPILRCLPMGWPYIHAGMELGETIPVNTGLGFTDDERLAFPPERLPLFSDVTLPWDSTSTLDRRIADFERRLRATDWFKRSSDDDDVIQLSGGGQSIVSYIRRCRSDRYGIIVVGNLGAESVLTTIAVPHDAGLRFIEPNDVIVKRSDLLSVTLGPWESVVVHALFDESTQRLTS